MVMTAEEVLNELQSLGKPSIKKVWANHGAKEPFYGVAIGDMKKLIKKIKVNHPLALELYDSGIMDAMYFAGLIADDSLMTKKDIERWVKEANWYMISEYTVPWVTAGGKYGFDFARKWIDSKKESIACAGWNTWSGLVALKPNSELDVHELQQLIERIGQVIHQQPNRVRYTMNGFIISVGGYIADLTDLALQTAKKIGKVSVDMSGTACKVPDASEYIAKMLEHGKTEKKRKTIKC